MNRLAATIGAVDVHGGLSVVRLNIGAASLQAIIIETPQTVAYLREGTAVFALFKETAVSLARAVSKDLSIVNQIPVIIQAIDRRALLTNVRLRCDEQTWEAVVPTSAVERMGLSPGAPAVALIRINEIAIQDREELTT